jgi:hypothetical protein
MNVLFGDVVVSGDMTIDVPVALFAFNIVVLEYTARSMSIIPKTILFKFSPFSFESTIDVKPLLAFRLFYSEGFHL